MLNRLFVTVFFVLSFFNFTYSQTCPSITIVRQPTSFDAWTGYSGTANNFSVYATSTGGALSYQWERSIDNGLTWIPVTASLDAGTTYSSFNAATLYYSNTSGSITALDGFKYRVRISNSTCFIYSNEVTLRVFGPSFFAALNLPATTNYCSSSPIISVDLLASSNSSMTSFAWERRIGSSGNWVEITSANANTLDAGLSYSNFNRADLQVTGFSAASESLQFRCKVTISVVSRNVIQTSSGSTTNSNSNSISGVYSSITSLAPGSGATITQMPPSLVSFCASGVTQTITTNATVTSGNVIYQWQRSVNGTSWVNLENDGTFSGVQTASLTIINPASTFNNNQLRCKVVSSNSNCNSFTTISTIKIGSPPTYSRQPPYPTSGSGTFCQNSESYNSAFFMPLISGMAGSNSSGFSFQWFRNTSNSYVGATAIDGQTNVGGYLTTDQAGTFYLFQRVTNAEGCSTNSAIVGPYTITPAPTITQQPSLPSTSICAGDPFSMSVSATPPTGGTLSYQWQRNGSPITGATSPTYSVASATTGMAGKYTVRITSSPGNCATTSAPIDLSVTAAPSLPTAVTASPTIICSDPNSTTNLSATTSVSNVIYWYETATGGTPIGFTNSGQTINVKPSATKTYYAETRAVKQLSFSFSREVQTWVVPQGISSMEVDIKGGGGGSGGTDSGAPGGGGGGARATGTITVTPGMKFRFAIGSEGTMGGGCRNPIVVFGGLGGYNALGYHGGRGGDSGFEGCSGGGGGGGAATVVQLLDANDNVLNTWILAGGGGGGGAGQFGNGSSGINFTNNQTINSIVGATGGTMVGDGAGGGAGGGGIKGGIGGGPGGEGGAPGGYQGQSQIGNLTSQTGSVGDGWLKITIAGSADFSCPSLSRVPVTVNVSQNASVIITTQPQPTLQCGSATSTFSVTATDATIYQWQVSSNAGTSWTNITGSSVPAFSGKTFAGFNSATLSVTATATSANSYLYRCIVSNDCSSATSNSALHDINAINSYTLANKVLCASPTSTTITSTVVGNSATLVQWERSANNGTTWQVVTPSLDAGTTYSGFNTGTLTINPVPNNINGYLYRIVASNSSCTNISNTALLTVTPTPIISTQPINVNNCNTGTAQFSVAASNTVTAYQWSVSSNGGATWTNISGATVTGHTGINYSGWNTATLGLSASPASANNYQYRCTLTNTCGTTVSNVARLNPTPYAGIITGPSILCIGNSATLSLIDAQLNGRTGAWTSSNTSVATVNSTTGVVTPIGVGTATITYTLSSSCPGTFTTTKSITIQSCADSDNDGVGDLIDIDDDNDGVLDSDEKCKLPNLLTSDGSFENLISVASSDAYNGNVSSASWTNGSGSADSWISPMPTTGSGVWGGMADGTPSSPNGGVFAAGWSASTTPNTTGESFFVNVTGLIVGQKYTIRFFQANVGIEGNTPLGDRANWRVVFGTEAKLTSERPYLGEGNQTWNEEELEFTATATSQRLEFFVNNGSDASLNGSTYDVMAIDGITLVRGGISDECILDTDNDGTPNHRDLDSDGDGCSDALESGATTSTTVNFKFTGTFGANGYINTLETAPESGIQNYVSNYAFNALSRNISTCADSDTDGISDLLDLDDDNDGVIDAIESPSCFYSASEFLSGNRSSTGIIISSDLQMSASYNTPSKLVDGDEAIGAAQYATQFIANSTIDEKTVYKFEFPISIEIEKIVLRFVNTNSPFNAGSVLKLQGSNNNTTWTDLNIASIFDATTNNSIESPFSTVAIPNEVFSVTQNRGKYKFYRIYALGGGINANGIANEVYFQIPSNYVASYNPKSLCSTDADNDGNFNHRDLDSDGDGCSDALESGATTTTTANFQFTGTFGANGYLNSLETATESGIANYSSTYVPYALSRNIDLCSDFDNDGVRDFNDLDDDNDGVLDAVESPSCFYQSNEFTNGNRAATAIGITSEISMSAPYNVFSKLLDGDETTGSSQYAVQFVNSTSIVNKEVYKFEFPVPMELTRINLRFVNTNSHFNAGTTIRLQGSNDNANWTDLNAGVTYDVTTDNNIVAPYWTVNTPNEQFAVAQNQGRYRFYRLFGTAGSVNSNGLPNEVYFTVPTSYAAGLNPKPNCSADTDNDGNFNHRDLDSDGDGCSDARESGATTSSTSNYQFTGAVGANGLDNSLETNDTGTINYTSTYSPFALSANLSICADTDSDGVGDLVDLDDDNDGVLDHIESASCFSTSAEAAVIASVSTGLQIYSNNTIGNAIDNNTSTYSAFNASVSWVGAELFRMTPNVVGGLQISGVQLDLINWAISSSTSNTFKLQGSNNGSTWVDLSAAVSSTAASGSFTISNTLQPSQSYTLYRIVGVAGTTYYGGVTEMRFLLPSTYNPSAYPKASCAVNTDGDAFFNHLDLDSDGDACSDALESGATTTTTANFQFTGTFGANGYVNSLETAPESGISNYSSTYVPYALSRTIDLCADFDSDGVRDFTDIDDDNDGVLDAVESPSCFYQSTEITNGIRTSTGIGITTEIPMNAPYNVFSKLVDGDETTGASQYAVQFVNGTSIVNKEVYKFEFPVPMELTRINLRFVGTPYSHFNAGTTIKLQGSNDNANWTDLNTGLAYDVTPDNNIVAPFWTVNTPNEQFAVTQNHGKYRFYRLFGTAGAVNSNGLSNEVYFTLPATYQASSNLKINCSTDTDGDQNVNHRDLDSDGDGCSDAKESNATTSAVVNFAFSGPVGTNGLVDSKETNPDSGVINYVSYYDNALSNTRNGCTDTDNDGIGDLVDIDDDNDGVLDTTETSSCATIGRDLTTLNFNGQAITSVTSTSIATANTQPQGLGWRTSYSSQTLPLPVSLTFKASSSAARDVMIGLMPANNTQSPTSWSDGGYKFYFTGGTVWVSYGGTGQASQAQVADEEYKLTISATGQVTFFINNVQKATFAGVNSDYRLAVTSYTAPFTFSSISLTDLVNLGIFTCTDLDTDNDGTPNRLDLDSDGDGCSDARETGATTSSTSNYQFTGAVGTNGLDNSLETSDNGTINYTSSYSPFALSANLSICADTDSDGVSDLVDLDDDNDGILDHIESVSCFSTSAEAAVIASVSTGLQIYSTNAIGNAIDNNTSTYSAFNPSISWVGAELFRMTPNVVGGLQISGVQMDLVNWAISSSTANTFKLQGSNNNGATWVDLSAAVSSTAASGSFTISNTLQPSQSYTLYRIVGVAGTTYYGGVTEMRFLLPSTYNPSAYPKASCAVNTDGDALFNHRDADSDGDGCNDAVESGIYPVGTNIPVAGSGNTNYGANGFVDAKETAAESGVFNGKYTYNYAINNTVNACTDTDNDGVGDIFDLDDDNDGVLDSSESLSCSEQGKNLSELTFNGNAIGSFTESTITTRNTGGWATSYSNQLLKLPISMTFKANSSVGIDNMFGLFPVSGTQTLSNWSDGGYKFYFTGTTVYGAFPSAWTFSQSRNVTDEYKITINSSGLVTVFINDVQKASFQGANTDYRLAISSYTSPLTFTNIVLLDNANPTPIYTCVDLDTDNDGTPNRLDLDSDGDGCFDAVEARTTYHVGAGIASGSRLNTSTISGTVGANGFVNGLETVAESGIYSGTYLYSRATTSSIKGCLDSDLDGVPDLDDLDDDNDGILDTSEIEICRNNLNFSSLGTTSQTISLGGGLTVNQISTTANVTGSDNAGNLALSSATSATLTFSSPVILKIKHATNTAVNFDSGDRWNISSPNATMSLIDPNSNLTVNSNPIGVINFTPKATANNDTEPWVITTSRLTSITFNLQVGNTASDLKIEIDCGFDLDTDNDGIPNRLDLDSDGDGCSDSNEAYNSSLTQGTDGNQQFGTNPITVDATGKITSATYTGTNSNYLSAGSASTITTQPVDQSVTPGSNAVFTTNVTTGSGSTTYQWQVSTDGGNTWVNVTNSSTYAGAGTSTLTVSNVPITFKGYRYRLQIFQSNFVCGNVISSVAKIVMNNTPSIVDDAKTGAEDAPVTGNVLTNDSGSGGSALTVTSYTIAGVSGTFSPSQTATIPNVGTIVMNADGTYTFTPAANYNGTVPAIDYTARDANGGVDIGTLALTITPVNDAPVAVDDVVSTNENTAVSGNVLTDGTPDSDADGNTITITQFTINGITYNPGDVANIPGRGSITMNANGSYTFTPTTGYTGPVPVLDYTLSDGNGGSDTGSLTITVVNVNDAPLATDDIRTILQGTTATGNLLTNDADVDAGAILTVTQFSFTINSTTYTYTAGSGVITMTGVGTIDIATNGVYTFVPSGTFTGTVPPITYTLSDGSLTDTGLLDIFVEPANTAPVAVADSQTTNEDTPASGNVLTNDTDTDSGTTLVVTQYSFTVPSGASSVTYTYPAGSTNVIQGVGTVVVNTNGNYTFTPFPNYNGTVPTIAYTISDGNGGTATANLSITVTAVNDTPIAVNDDNKTTPEDTPVTVNVLTNDSDIDGSTTLTVTQFTISGITGTFTNTAVIPNKGTVNVLPTGELTFTPVANFNGVVPTITYTVTDGTATATANVNISVTPVNDLPVVVNESLTTLENTAITSINLLTNDTDVETGTASLTITQFSVAGVGTNTSVTYAAGTIVDIAGVGSIIVNANGSFTFTPNTGYFGTVPVITYAVSDGNGGVTNGTLAITVTPVNDPPIVISESVNIQEDAVASGNLLTNDSDPENNLLTISQFTIAGISGTFTSTATIPNVGTITINANGTYTFTPTANYNGVLPLIEYTVSDGQGAITNGNLQIVVAAVNDAPIVTNENLSAPINTVISNNVLTNDRDVEGATLTITQYTIGGVNYPAGQLNTITGVGTIVINADGSFVFTPATNYVGAAPTISYTVSDGTATSAGTLSLTITPIDTDGDGIPDATEKGTGQTPIDTDGDNIPDWLDPDSDNDGIPDSIEDAVCIGVLPCTPTDTDNDGTPDYRDTDSDGDGILDATEDAGCTGNAPCTPTDTDGDGVPNHLDLDSDGDGISDATEKGPTSTPRDTDGDATPDYLDMDSDGDGISDATEGTVDTDGDGTPNYRDTDSDGDGITDAIEGTTDTDGDGNPNYIDTDSDGDGISDAIEKGSSATPVDTDGDGIPDYKDLDSDNDGIPDSVEGAADADNDGIPNFRDLDSDGDGISDAIEKGSNGASPLDTDGDGTPNYLDVDSDGDGIPDRVEGRVDSDGDGIPNYLDTDSDGDGILDSIEDAGCTGTVPCTPTDTDGDGTPNYLDIDSDGDGISDNIEKGPSGTPVDTDNDGTPDYLDTDSDGDGITDAVEKGPGSTPLDTDGDGTPDFRDLDSDGDGITDAVEGTTDTDGDGTPNYRDLDSDGDGKSDVTEGNVDTDNDGTPNYLDLDSDSDGVLDAVDQCLLVAGLANLNGCPLDSDGDGLVDTVDTDDDNDGILDTLEAAACSPSVTDCDTDGDGIPNRLDLDSDGDGISDVIEANGTDADKDGRADGAVDSNGVPASANGGLTPPNTDATGTSNPYDVDSDGDGIFDAIEKGSGSTLADTDNDNTPDYLDLDSDGDGISDAIEGSVDTDGDGIPNFRDLDSDGDGITDAIEGNVDTDGDGTPNFKDVDSDGDGISDAIEGTTNTDGDSTPNYLDADSDGDGIPDAIEKGPNATPVDTDNDSTPDYLDTDSDGDGILDSIEDAGCTGTVPCTPTDTDGDGIPNFKDLDSDGDGISDAIEKGPNATPVDTDNDSTPDYLDTDSDGDGISDALEGNIDSDNDGTPNYLDLDSDGDGIPDSIEKGPTATPVDTDNDGRPDYLDVDTDGDGIPDSIEDAACSGTTCTPTDTDGDGIPNHKDLDSDGDGIPDSIERGVNGNNPENTDGTDTPNYLDTDSDNDGILDAVERGINGNSPLDTDGDGIPDYKEVDSDNDGIPDAVEGTLDTDGDGIPDYRDTDSDNDGILDATEDASCSGTAPCTPTDTDNDGIPNYKDLDSDADNKPDISEGESDFDGDTIPNYLDPDSDGDGINDIVDQCPLLPGIVGNNGCPVDTDADGIFDINDLDDDNDGILDTVEAAACSPSAVDCDSDADGIPNRIDPDSDNDGINDVREANGTDVDGDGKVDGTVDANGVPTSTGGGLTPPNTDGTTLSDPYDTDSDGDGIPDALEKGTNGNAPVDTDGDGIPDYRDTDSDNDGIPDSVERGTGTSILDTDGDGIPDFRDLDSDNDGITDAVEKGPNGATPLDTDNDGIPNYRDLDSDGDGLTDASEKGTGSTLLNTDGDSLPNYLDPDSDNDGISDAIEKGFNPASPVDTDGDGIPNHLDLDSDGDGIPDAVEGTTDTDGDGIPNYIDTDSDGDGILDSIEDDGCTGTAPCTPTDTDGDGIPNYLDLDTDGDGKSDAIEKGPTTTPMDSDGDGIPDYRDVDNLGRPDVNVTNKSVPVTGNVKTNDPVPAGTTYAQPAQISGATLTMNADGTYTFTSAVPGKYLYFISVCAPSQTINCPLTSLEITVLDPAASDAPVANNDYATIEQGTSSTVSVLVNDKVGDAHKLLDLASLSVTTAPTRGTVVVNADGTIAYTPGPFFVGRDSLVYTICDNGSPALCRSAKLYFTVEVAGAPALTTAVDDYNATWPNVPVTGSLLANDNNTSGASLTASVVTGPTSSQGTFTMTPSGNYTFTAASGFSGPVEIIYQACTVGGVCSKATLHILVDPAPTLVDDAATAYINIAKPGNVSTNDVVPTGTTYGQPAQITGATITVDASGTYTFTATAAGTYTYTIPVCAPGQTTNCPTETLVITVPVNTLVDDAATAYINIAKPGNVSTNDVVPTGTTYGQPAQITGATITVDASGTYTFTATAAGTYTYTIPVCAPGQTTNCPTETLVITVPVNTLVDDAATAYINIAKPGNVSTNDVVPTGTTYGQPAQITGATITVDASGTYTFTATAAGTYTYTIPVCAPGQTTNCPTETLVITVPVNTLVDDAATAYINIAKPGNVSTNDVVPTGTTYGQPAQITGATITVDASGTYTFTATAAGTYTYTIPVCAPGQTTNCPTETLVITVPVNTLVDDVANALTGIPKPGNVSTNDLVPVGTTYGQPAQITGATITVDASGTYTFTATAAGTYTYTIPVCAPGQTTNCPTETLVITVASSNTAPVATPDTKTVAEDTPATGNVLTNDTDVDGNTLTVTKFTIGGVDYAAGTTATIPNVGTVVVNADGTYTFTPVANYNGSVPTITVTITDGTLTATAPLEITVTAVNDAPVATRDTKTVAEDTPATGNVLSNDTDVDGNTLSVTKFTIGGVDYAAGTTATIPNVGTVVVNADGTYTFTPVANYNGSVPTITVTITDGTATATAPLDITVTAVNDAPVATPDTKTVAEDTPATGNVLSNDTDVDGNTLSVTKFTIGGVDYAAGTTATIPNVGTVVVNADGTYTFTPVANYNGTVPTITVTITDGTLTATAPLDITVTSVNDAPVATPDTNTVAEDTPATGNVLTNDTDIDGNTLTVTKFTIGGVDFAAGTTASIPNVGTIVVNADGTYTFTPVANYNGTVPTITVTITDGSATATAPLNITVTAVNDAPVATPDTKTVGQDTPATGNVLSNDTDVEGNTLSVTKFTIGGVDYAAGTTATIPNVGTVVVNTDGTYTFTPVANYNGTVPTITVTITDGATTATAPLDITVLKDSDNDGVPDDIDLDDDNDGIIDTFENAACTPSSITCDTDGDGIPNSLDLDSDGDGLMDVLEGGGADANGDGKVDGGVDASGIPLAAKGGLTPPDTDGDGKYNPYDIDADGDGVPDATEKAEGTNPADPCSYNLKSQTLVPAASWMNADCNNDKIPNGEVMLVTKYATKPVLQSDGTFKYVYSVVVRNTRPETITNITLKDDLSKVFTSPMSFVVTGYTASGTLIKSVNYDGRSNIDLVTSASTLVGYGKDSVTISVTVNPNGYVGDVNNIADVTATTKWGNVSRQSIDTVLSGGRVSGTGLANKVAIPRIDLVIAGGFSPNRDGIDDKFIILKPGGTNIKLQIFNRWGNVVYQNNNYQNEWDGRGIGNMLGQDLPAGTYYYSVMAILPSGEVKKFAGPVTLIR